MLIMCSRRDVEEHDTAIFEYCNNNEEEEKEEEEDDDDDVERKVSMRKTKWRNGKTMEITRAGAAHRD